MKPTALCARAAAAHRPAAAHRSPATWRTTARALPAVLAALAALAGCAGAPPAGGAAAPETVQLRVIGFNDFHGHLEPATLTLSLPDATRPGTTQRVPVGGAAAMAGLVATLRAQVPHTVVVSAGDMVGAAPLVSTLFRHETTVELMNRLGVDVAAVGNHEFDAGVRELQRLVAGGCSADALGAPGTPCALAPYAGARFAVLAANVMAPGGQPLFAPAWVRQVGPVRVGFIGAVTRGTPKIVMPSGIAGLRFDDEAEAINRSAQALQAQGVNALVVTLHEGGEIGAAQQPGDWNDERCPGLRGRIVDLAARITPAVDLIISGHTHQGYRCVIDGRPVIQSTSYSRGLSVTDLVIDARTGRVDRAATRSRNLPVLNERTDAAQRERVAAAEPEPWATVLRQARPDPAVQAEVARFSAAVAPRAQRVVGRIQGSFERSGRGQTTAGQLIADAQLAATRDPARGGAQLALMNPGGIRADLACRQAPPCPVTFGEAFTMQPFGNSLVVMSLTGAQLRELLESQQGPGRAAPTLLQPSSNLRYQWLASRPHGQRVADLQLDGAPVRPEAVYRLTVNGFLAEGGDGFALLATGRDRTGGGQDIDALLAHLAGGPAPQPPRSIVWVD